VPLLYLASDENSGVPQPAHTNLPRRFSLLSGLQSPGRTACAWAGGSSKERQQHRRPGRQPATAHTLDKHWTHWAVIAAYVCAVLCCLCLCCAVL
jgi:hypothetical protein